MSVGLIGGIFTGRHVMTLSFDFKSSSAITLFVIFEDRTRNKGNETKLNVYITEISKTRNKKEINDTNKHSKKHGT